MQDYQKNQAIIFNKEYFILIFTSIYENQILKPQKKKIKTK